MERGHCGCTPGGYSEISHSTSVYLPARLRNWQYIYINYTVHVDAAAMELENPFAHLPLKALCNSLERDVYRAIDEHKILTQLERDTCNRTMPSGAVQAMTGPKGRHISRINMAAV